MPITIRRRALDTANDISICANIDTARNLAPDERVQILYLDRRSVQSPSPPSYEGVKFFATLGDNTILGCADPMTRPLPLLAGLLGVVFLALAVIYWFTPAGSLPSFFPGFEAGVDNVHFKHALGSLILALALFALAWFLSARQRD